jgi:hypothetical protein
MLIAMGGIISLVSVYNKYVQIHKVNKTRFLSKDIKKFIILINNSLAIFLTIFVIVNFYFYVFVPSSLSSLYNFFINNV